MIGWSWRAVARVSTSASDDWVSMFAARPVGRGSERESSLAEHCWTTVPHIGIDLGTGQHPACWSRKGIVINEPSVVAINRKTKRVLAIGSEAKRMVGRTPANIVAIRPLKDGVISDFDVTERCSAISSSVCTSRSRSFRDQNRDWHPIGSDGGRARAVYDAP